ncbi:hypothetical protein PSPL106493_18535 [Pseudomonas plecoglossicida]
MIDLRSPDAALSEYAQRYHHLLPEVSPQLLRAWTTCSSPTPPGCHG